MKIILAMHGGVMFQGFVTRAEILQKYLKHLGLVVSKQADFHHNINIA